MITYLLMTLMRDIFWAMLDVFKALVPDFFTAMTDNLVNLLAMPGMSFGLFLINTLIPLTFLMSAVSIGLIIILSGKIWKWLRGVISK
jgi:hypothetical protein